MSTDPKPRFEENTQVSSLILFPSATQIKSDNNVNSAENALTLVLPQSSDTKPTFGSCSTVQLNSNEFLVPTTSGFSKDDKKHNLKDRILKKKRKLINNHIKKFSEYVLELFYLERNASGNYLDLKSARRKNNSALLEYLQKHTLEAQEPDMLIRALFGRNPFPVPANVTAKENSKDSDTDANVKEEDIFNSNFALLETSNSPVVASVTPSVAEDVRSPAKKTSGRYVSKRRSSGSSIDWMCPNDESSTSEGKILPSRTPVLPKLNSKQEAISDDELTPFTTPTPSVNGDTPVKRPTAGHKQLSHRAEVTSDDDLIILTLSTPPSKPDDETPVKRLPVGPKPPKKYSEKMKAEASIMQRIQDLQKEGMWYDKRLPKICEQPRYKAHWDYLLEEMMWLSADFVYERKWKILAAKKCSKMIEKYFHDRAIATQRAEKEEEIRKRRQCTYLAKEIRNFWANAQKLVEMSEKSRIEQLRKKALDVHLSFIVKQTEKYSNMLAETFANKTGSKQESPEESSVDLSPHNHSEEEVSDPGGQDDDFEPLDSEEDDEETIITAEAEAAKDKMAVDQEVALLAEESAIPMDDFLDQLPEGYLDWRLGAGKDIDNVSEKSAGRNSVTSANSNELADITDQKDNAESSDNSSDVEEDKKSKETVVDPVTKVSKDISMDTSTAEQSEDVKSIKEVVAVPDTKPLTENSDISKKIKEEKPEESESKEKSERPSKESNRETSTRDGGSDSEEEWDSNSESEEYDSEGSETEIGTDEDEDPDQTIGLASLLQTFAPERAGEDHDDTINSVAAEAESFQPKGYTLSSTTVVTKVPFLLKHTLREYQHIGLDWLVAMYTKKLNGILADEMGLGKTIQTIALLAHLACEKGNWGPHLIVVPTSVMLNWEMEFKKWCPGFKILTYYGLQKERKLKRQGWTKPNTFHVCITSYKLVIQDHQSFRRKRWKYLILDEAQNIKNFKSQRWQLLLNFQTQRRLLLTGTPLQNNLMELWSLMHFLMPTVFQSHREFREWFSDPVSNMVEGDSSYDDNIIQRLHKVLRPFILRRLKSEVEKQLPQKYNHVILCRLSKRQRYLYEEYMERSNTKETLNKGNLLSVINVLMQLRKVCNHPNLFEPRPIISPFQVVGINCTTPSLVWNIIDDNKINYPSFSMYKITEADFKLSKEDGTAIWNRRCKFSKLSEHVKEEKVNDGVRTLPSMVIETKEHSKQPPYKRARLSPPPIPQIDLPLPWWMTNVDPNPYLQDPEFVSALSYGARPKPELPPRTIIINGGQKLAKVALPAKAYKEEGQNAPPKYFPFNENRAVGDVSARHTLPSKPLPELDVDDRIPQSEETTAPTPNNSQDSAPTKSPFSKLIPKFDVSNLTPGELKMAKAKYTSLVGMRKYAKSVVENRKRKVRPNMRGIVPSWLQSIGISNPDEFLLPEIEERRLQDTRDVLLRLKKINEERCKITPIIGAGTVKVCEAFYDLPSMRYFGRRRRRLGFEPLRRRKDRNHFTDGYFFLGYGETHLSLFLKLCSPDSSFRNHPQLLWRMTKGLMNLTWTLQEQLQMLSEIIKRFVIYVPAVSVPKPHSNFFRPKSTYYYKQVQMDRDLEHQLRRPAEVLHPVVSRMSTQFPDPRLIEYDCGKLQVLNRLLRALKAEDHRVLLFTQMAKMLDVLEAFLNYHGHIYLRLDGATKIEERQILMERFNSDKRIFCFILSTRSGGIGVNLTGADTVIFYDSDWNPTMDAQAQDRCHRIGQTRDVNIYRLVSERTIEENILKKSNQKRILGELAIEGGNFTTAYFKKDSIFDLFNVDSFESDPLQRIRSDLESSTSVMNSAGVYTRFAKPKEEVVGSSDDPEKAHLFESALAEAEDETDVQAARTVQAEAAAELAEFDENIPLEDPLDEEDMTPKTDVEMKIISAELTPVERYALRFMEHYIDDWSRETVSSAKKEIEHQKREWELEQLRKETEKEAKEEAESSDLEDMITYPGADARTQVWTDGINVMPMWCPPTPPADNERDVYIDQAHGYLYAYETIPDHLLPPVYVPPPPKIPKKPIRQPTTTEKRETSTEVDVWKESQATFSGEFTSSEQDETLVNKKIPKVQRRDEPIFAPRSLFDKPSPAMAKLRRDYRMQKYNPGRPVPSVPKTTLGPGAITFPITPAPSAKPLPLPTSDNSPEWTLNEDQSLLQAITQYLELPLSLLVVNLAQTPNWDLCAEIVNLNNKTHRTAKQCKHRYETVVGPREEGKLFYEPPATTSTVPATSPSTSPTVKKKKSKAFIKIGPPSPSRAARLKTTAQLIVQDNNSQLSTMFTQKFDLIKNITNRKVPTNKPMTINPHIKQSKQAAIFTEHGINYDNPLPATTIAQTRYERLQLERKKLIAAQQVAAAAAAASASGGSIMGASSPANANIIPQSILAAMNSSNSSSIPVSVSASQGTAQMGTVSVTSGQSVGVAAASSPTEVQKGSRQLSNVTNLTNTSNVLPVVISQGGELVSRNAVPTHLLSPQRSQLNLTQQSVQLQHQLQILQHNQMQQKHKQLQFSLATQSGSVSGQQQALSQQQQLMKAQQQSVQMQPQHHNQQQSQTVVLSAGLAQALGTAVGSPVTVTATPGGNVTISTAGTGTTVSSMTTVNARNQQILAHQAHAQQQQQMQKTINTISMQDLVSVSSAQRMTQAGTTMATTIQSQSTPSTIVSLTPATVIGTGQQIATKLVQGQGNVATLVSTSSKVPGTVSMKGSNVNTMQLQFVRQGALIRQPSTVTTASQQQQIRDHLQNQHQQIKRIQMVTSTGQTAIVSSANVGSGISVSAAPSSMSAVSTMQSSTTPTSALPVSLVQASPMMTVSTSTPLGTVATVVTPGSTRQVQLVKQHTVGGKTVTRAISESEVAAILKQHGLSNSTRLAIASTSGGTQIGSQKGQVTQVQVPVGSLGNNPTHTLLTSVNLQNLGFKMQQSGSGSPVATIVKTPASQAGQSGTAVFPLTLSQVKSVGKGSAVATKQQQIQLNNLQQQLLNQQRRQQQQQQQQQLQNTGKITHITQVTPQGTLPTQLIVQATPKQLQNAIAQQQFQQVFKQVNASGQILGQGGQVLQAHMLSKPISVGSSPTTMAVTTSSAGSSVIGGGGSMVSQGPTSVTVSANLINTAGQNVHARIVPVSSQGLKPSVQVVSAPNTLMSTGNLARPQITTSNSSLSFTNLKMSPGMSQATAGSLQGQPLSIRLQTSGMNSPSPVTAEPVTPQITVASAASPVVSSSPAATAPPAATLIVTEEIAQSQSQPTIVTNIPSDSGAPSTQSNQPSS